MSIVDMGKNIPPSLDDFGMVDVSEGCMSDARRIGELRDLLDNKPYIEGAAFRREVTRIVMGEKG